MKDKKPSAERFRTKKNGSSSEKALSSRKLPGASRVNEGAALQIWKQIDDVLVPRLRLSVIDRAAYCHLLRHSRLEGKARLRFSIPWLARGIRLSEGPTRQAVRRLVDKGALRLVERTKAGHVVEVRLPGEIRAAREQAPLRLQRASHLEEMDFLQSKELREAIHARECGVCFYCLRRLTREGKCLDHVVPRVQLGRDGYRNLVSCCLECNSQKGERPAEHFLRWLYRERHLTGAELTGRLRALDALAAGRLRPVLSLESSLPRCTVVVSAPPSLCKMPR